MSSPQPRLAPLALGPLARVFAAAPGAMTLVLLLSYAGASVAQTTSGTPAASNSALGRPRYDANEQALRIPYAGAVPTFTRGTLKQPPRIFLDFDAPSRLTGVISEGVPNHPVWLSWAMAPREKTRTRLTLVFRRDTTIAVRVDRERQFLLVVPRIPAPETGKGLTTIDESLPTFPENSPAPTPTPRKPAPAPSVKPTPTPQMTPWSPPRPIMTAWPTQPTPAPVMTPWIPQRTPAPMMTPWIPQRTPLPVVTPSPAPLPSDLGLIYLPGSPEPSETPTITISQAPLLPASAAPAATPRSRTDVEHMVSAAGAYGYYEEVPVGQTVAYKASNQGILGARLQSRIWPAGHVRKVGDGWLPWWGFGLDLYGTNVAYGDPITPTGLYARQEWRSHLAFTRGIRLSPLELQGGLGLQARYEVSTASGTPTSTAAVASGWRAIVAPEILLAGRLPFAGALEVYGEGAMAPLAFALLPTGQSAAPSLTSTRFEFGLGGTWSGLRLAAGYRRWSLTGAGYGETFQGPVLTLGGWLDPEAGQP